MLAAMELVIYADADIALTEAIECDPEAMKELGGPIPRSEIPEVHRRRLAAADEGWWLKIVPDPGGPAVGTIGIWTSSWQGAVIHEVGWTVLPRFQGRGHATEALRLLLERIRAEPTLTRIHAFPGVTNAPSNALCRKFGFSNLGECEVRFRERPLRCSHWELTL
jgi:RimJ/RimL family protein N-acetyltransferase